MSAAEERKKRDATPPPSLAARIVRSFLLVLVVMFFLTMLGIETFLILPLTFLFGWIPFLRDVVPQITWNWELIATGVICLAIFVWGFHRTATWMRQGASSAEVGWRWRWTVTVTLGVMCFFTATIAVIGVLHQSIWLAKTDEPMLRNVMRHPRMILMATENFIARKVASRPAERYQVTGDAIRAELPKFLRQSRAPDVRITVLSGPQDHFTGLIIDMRDTEWGKRHGIQAYRWDGAKMEFHAVVSDPAQLPEFIAEALAGHPLERFSSEEP